jgi:hypothetical protein
MGEVIRFVPKPERERARLVREARAIYDGIFPPANPVSKSRTRDQTIIRLAACPPSTLMLQPLEKLSKELRLQRDAVGFLRHVLANQPHAGHPWICLYGAGERGGAGQWKPRDRLDPNAGRFPTT